MGVRLCVFFGVKSLKLPAKEPVARQCPRDLLFLPPFTFPPPPPPFAAEQMDLLAASPPPLGPETNEEGSLWRDQTGQLTVHTEVT